jgi:hypothetical protein
MGEDGSFRWVTLKILWAPCLGTYCFSDTGVNASPDLCFGEQSRFKNYVVSLFPYFPDEEA